MNRPDKSGFARHFYKWSVPHPKFLFGHERAYFGIHQYHYITICPKISWFPNILCLKLWGATVVNLLSLIISRAKRLAYLNVWGLKSVVFIYFVLSFLKHYCVGHRRFMELNYFILWWLCYHIAELWPQGPNARIRYHESVTYFILSRLIFCHPLHIRLWTSPLEVLYIENSIGI